MSDTIERARQRQAELRAELEKINKFLALYDELQEKLGTDTEHSETATKPICKPVSGRVKRRRSVRPQDIANAVVRIIRDAGKPMVRGEIADAVEAGGIKIPSKDKPRYIGTVLWRENERFVNIEKHGYWLVGEDCPAVGYVAADDPNAVGAIPPPAEEKAAAEAELFEDMKSRGLVD